KLLWCRRSYRLRANAPNEGKACLAGNDLFCIISVKPCVGYDCIGYPLARVDLRHPPCFPNLIVSIALGLHVNRLKDIMTLSINAIIIGKVAALQPIKTIYEEVIHWLVGEPRIINVLQ